MAHRFTMTPPPSPRATSLGAALRIDVTDPLTDNYEPPQIDVLLDGVELDEVAEAWLVKARAQEIYAHVRNSGFSQRRRQAEGSGAYPVTAEPISQPERSASEPRGRQASANDVRPADFERPRPERRSGEHSKVRRAEFPEATTKPNRVRKCRGAHGAVAEDWAPPTERDPRARRRDW
jgi:hypothetical protein